MKLKFLLVAGAAFGLVACGETAEDTDLETQTDVAAEQTDESAMADPAMPTSAQEFATMQAASDAYEIEAGGMAQENASDQAVQEFGGMMVDDHTTSTENLRTALQQVEGVSVEPQMTAEQQSNLDALRDAGEDFDRVYLEQQVAAHEKALGMLRNYADNGDSEPLRQFASQTADVVEGHLEQARQLHGQMQ